MRVPDAVFVGGSGNADFIGQAAGNRGALARSCALAHVRPRRRSPDDARTAQERGVVQNNAVGGEALKCPVTPHPPTRRRL